jgi:hypothetical protein
MEAFRDPSGITRAAVAALYVDMVLEALSAALSIADPGGPGDLAAIPAFVVLIACFILVGRWIYVTNANAHLLSDDMTVTPGWAVGWYFVPFANLVKPYQGMKETWQASHYAGGLHEETETALLPWWWGLWILTNILGNISMQISMRVDGLAASPSQGVLVIDLVAAALNVPLCLILIRLMRRLARAQTLAAQVTAFA